MAWWKENRLRLIQTNLRDTDGGMNVDLLIRQLKNLSANALQFNTGGIMAFYPTELKYHYQNPYLKKDLLGEVIEKCHQNSMRFIARFDFSKAHVSIFEENPEWFYRSPKGEIVNYNDMVHTCVNGFYQSEYSLEIIKEALTKYPIDGIFFNMFGYQTTDYSGNYYGICHCENCKKRFMEIYHLDLPDEEDMEDPVYRKYLEFKEVTTKELLEKIHNLVKSINTEIPISTYTDYKVDMIRKESNTAVDRQYPIWLYSASENVKSVENTWEDKVISNCSINAVDIPYRFMGVSQHLIRLRLYQSIASGSGLDFCINGVFEDYPDRENFGAVKEVFDFHKKNELYYGCFQSIADVALIKPAERVLSNGKEEYLGIFKMLKEQHILFDVICEENINARLKDLDRYGCVILPDVRILEDEKLAESMKNLTVPWILTGVYPSNGNARVYNIIDGRLIRHSAQNRSAYLKIQEKEVFQRFPDRDWLFLDRSFTYIEFNKNHEVYLPFMEPARFGPPERCGGYSVSDSFGVGIKNCGNAKLAAVPWEIGSLYQKYGYEDHKKILLDILDYLMGGRYTFTTNAPMDVELFLNSYENGDYILQILNVSGYNGSTFYKPNPIHDIDICLDLIPDSLEPVVISREGMVDYKKSEGKLMMHIDRLDCFQAFILKKDSNVVESI